MKKIIVTMLLFFFIVLFSNLSFSKTITQCGESKGVSIYLKNGVFGDLGGFKDDGFGGSKIVLEAVEDPDSGNTKVDVIFFNGNTPYRASEAGPVALINMNPVNGTWMILAVAGTYIDTYLFSLDQNGKGEVVWTNSRSGGTPKAVLMKAVCG